MAQPVDAARTAFEHREWQKAYDGLRGTPDLDVDDLERLAVAAYLVGEDDASTVAWDRAHQACVDAGDADRAVRCAVYQAITLILRGDMAQAGGWLARAGRIVEEEQPDGPGAAYPMVPAGLHALNAGQFDEAYGIGKQAEALGQQHGDADLRAFGLLTCGQAAIGRGDVALGTAHLDEVMVSVTAGEVSPIPAGIIYCAVIDQCVKCLDLRRASEWTESLNAWCEEQPDLVPYRGQCLVHRSQVFQAHGEWEEAEAEAERARVRLAQPPHPALGLACYQRAELHRLRGEFGAAADAYKAASLSGYEPMPGLALLRLAEGKIDSALASIRRALDEADEPLPRIRLLAAAVEVQLAAEDVAGAAAAAEELEQLIDAVDAPLVRALAAHAVGNVTLSRGDATAALKRFREAQALWGELEMPYEAARTRLAIGAACQTLGDTETAALELDAARQTFAALHAQPDLDQLVSGLSEPRDAGDGLTNRECEVLRLVAAGRTNKQIADELVISEHTVARHVQNIFAKTGVTSRSAATAYAYEHDLA